ncbi:MAG: hypothetical protein EAZ91_23645 [Cytophagales bacterium]|nr:MAG: hypothetical protein EAZ91_23645 [Cytophagales bacterium]
MNTPNLDAVEEKFVRYSSLLANQIFFLNSQFPDGITPLNSLTVEDRYSVLYEYRMIFGDDDESYPEIYDLMGVRIHLPLILDGLDDFNEAPIVRQSRKEIEAVLWDSKSEQQKQLFFRRIERQQALLGQVATQIETVLSIWPLDNREVYQETLRQELLENGDAVLVRSLGHLNEIIRMANGIIEDCKLWDGVLLEYEGMYATEDATGEHIPTNKEIAKTTLHEKLLILHYMGLDLSKIQYTLPFNQTKFKNLLAHITGQSPENIKKALALMNEDKETTSKNIFSKNNLLTVAAIFRKQKLDDLALEMESLVKKRK